MNMGIKGKLLFSYSTICTLLVCIGLLGAYSIHKIESNYQIILDSNFKKILLVGSIQNFAKESNLPVMQLASGVKTAGKVDELESDFKNSVLKYTETKKIYDALPLIQNEGEVLKKLSVTWDKYYVLSEKAFQMAKGLKADDKTADLETFLNDEVDTVRIELNDAMARVAVFQKESAETLAANTFQMAERLNTISIVSVVIGFILSIVLGSIFAKQISKSLLAFQGQLSHEANSIQASSEAVGEHVKMLKEKLETQATGVQQMVVACEEVSAMVKTTADGAQQSSAKATRSQEQITEGSQSITYLVDAIEKIVESFSAIRGEVTESQKSVQLVSKLINEIKTKTSVINGIVFQTKLLSFNASVEAARAGDNGKGFAVVADEMGALAKMSGDAAEEINTLIDQSAGQIVEIFNDMQNRIGNQLESGVKRISEGQTRAQSCAEVFTAIKSVTSEILTQVQSVAAATNEQSTGIAEINNSVSLIDTTAQENSVLVQQISETTVAFRESVTALTQVSTSLLVMLNGSDADRSANDSVGA